MNNLRWAFTALMVLAATLAVACSGGFSGDAGSPPGTGASGGASIAAPSGSGAAGGDNSGAPETPAATTPQAEGLPPRGGALDVAAATSMLNDIESYRFDMSLKMDVGGLAGGSDVDAAAAALLLSLLGNIELEGAYVAPDRFEFSTSFFGMDIQSIQIGDQAWTNQGEGWIVDTATGASSIEFTSPADLPIDLIPPGEIEGAKTSTETVNGVETTRYSFDKDSLAELAASAGETMGIEDLDEASTVNLDVWLTSDGVPVKMSLLIEGESEGSAIAIEMEYNIKDLNDAGISIEAPI